MSQRISPYSRWQDAMFTQHRILDSYHTSLGLSYLEGFIDDVNSAPLQVNKRAWEFTR